MGFDCSGRGDEVPGFWKGNDDLLALGTNSKLGTDQLRVNNSGNGDNVDATTPNANDGTVTVTAVATNDNGKGNTVTLTPGAANTALTLKFNAATKRIGFGAQVTVIVAGDNGTFTDQETLIMDISELGECSELADVNGEKPDKGDTKVTFTGSANAGDFLSAAGCRIIFEAVELIIGTQKKKLKWKVVGTQMADGTAATFTADATYSGP